MVRYGRRQNDCEYLPRAGPAYRAWRREGDDPLVLQRPSRGPSENGGAEQRTPRPDQTGQDRARQTYQGRPPAEAGKQRAFGGGMGMQLLGKSGDSVRAGLRDQ